MSHTDTHTPLDLKKYKHFSIRGVNPGSIPLITPSSKQLCVYPYIIYSFWFTRRFNFRFQYYTFWPTDQHFRIFYHWCKLHCHSRASMPYCLVYQKYIEPNWCATSQPTHREHKYDVHTSECAHIDHHWPTTPHIQTNNRHHQEEPVCRHPSLYRQSSLWGMVLNLLHQNTGIAKTQGRKKNQLRILYLLSKYEGTRQEWPARNGQHIEVEVTSVIS